MARAAHPLTETVSAALRAAADPDFQQRQQGYSKEAVQSLGVRTAATRAIAKAHFPTVKAMPLGEALALCEELLASGIAELRVTALTWAHNRRRELRPEHYDLLRGWLLHHVDNWATCDQLCCEVFGDFMVRHPQFVGHCLEWARSDNRWLRRAAAVILIPDLRKEALQLPTLLAVAAILLPDRDDLVQKGYGWALKEATDSPRRDDVATWVMAHRHQMSRTALRYAIEKMDPRFRTQAMERP